MINVPFMINVTDDFVRRTFQRSRIIIIISEIQYTYNDYSYDKLLRLS